MRIAILGSGHIGHALGALLGSRPEFQVKLWGRKVRTRTSLVLRCVGSQSVYAIGRVLTEPALRKAVDGADMVVLAVPAHVRKLILSRIAGQLRCCLVLVAWEGMGRFAETIGDLGISVPACVGLQRSPIVCRTEMRWRSVEMIGVRSMVVAATVDPAASLDAERLMSAVFPFRFTFAPSYHCVSLSPANPLIHPARLYSLARCRRRLTHSLRFYADWDDDASEVLLALHNELARLRDRLRLPVEFVRTLADRSLPPTPARLTHEIRSERGLTSIQVPLCNGPSGLRLNFNHRFFREDIGEGLQYIVSAAKQAGASMPVSDRIRRWYIQSPAGNIGC